MQLYQVRYFLKVCEIGNFTRAARSCNVSQPSLSRAITKLEQELGGPLFERSADGVRLTAFGNEIRPYLQDMVDVEAEAVELAKNRMEDRKSALNIGIMCTLGTTIMQPFLKELTGLAPEVTLNFTDGTSEELSEKLEMGLLDMCITTGDRFPKGFEVHPLYEERYVVSFYKGHRFEDMQAVPFDELEGEPYVLRRYCELSLSFEDLLPDQRRPQVKVVFESSHEHWVQSMIQARLGCTVHPETFPVMDGILQRPIVDTDVRRRVNLVVNPKSPSQRHLNRVLRLARDFPA
ncbi:LysR family transcriptional regulator [Ruegeria sp.]|uniref:LysR family transcriptional regulator n=1 Tax=Ruegeria sp. TaxID=1879320 RepID=UPI003B5B585D